MIHVNVSYLIPTRWRAALSGVVDLYNAHVSVCTCSVRLLASIILPHFIESGRLLLPVWRLVIESIYTTLHAWVGQG